MAQIGASSLISFMDSSSNYRTCNHLSPPDYPSFALPYSHSNTINPRRSTPSATIISPQPSFGRERLSKKKPRSGNLRIPQDVPTIFKINKALSKITKSGKYSTALSHFNELQFKDIELDLYTFNIAINCYCCANQVGFGFSLLGSIFKRGYTPNVVTLTTLLNRLIAQDKAGEALSLLNKLQLQDIELNLYSFNIAINCYCCVNRVGFGFSLLGNIFKRGYTPCVVTFTSLLNGLIVHDKTVEAVEFFEKIVKKGEFKPDVSRYGSFINRLCKMGNKGAAISFLRIAEDGGLKPNTTIYSMIIDRLCKDGMVDDGVNFLVEMNSKGIRANVITYSSLIDSLCKHGKWKEATGMLREMVDSGISPNVCTTTVLVSALCKQGKTKKAEELLEGMMARGVDPDTITYSALMNGYCLQGLMDEAMRLFNAMVDRGIHPNNYC
ncbi:hypothetical protein RHMOL_Rhmol04G0308900 [Rhododendron molle]|uniref:Uncharacterized protein n=1 Tax=Rhododendron molle TaxID=49168 RepID=A0ACC0P7C4_RHOML|nr:hypothetical protein RHMOL_Rhmol04G0308900 [Rhododendron molle]